ncbi:TraB/GumN family protein [Sphingopyxis flava]|uniref:TraB family protein n=1 Tax=Sphingopyxis flava TaxID=1507287 RepID=A0A1T5D8N1_9SPHN|nr:TraB/GumN family protein [Sphingopyxis flava]SKB67903.1 hypothetical protein SAMN06295937_101369 [Sphingopyxis flava]
MKKWIKAFATSCAIIPLAQCALIPGNSYAFEPAAQVAPVAPVATQPLQTIDADPALWVVKDEDTTIYLFGTIHVLKPGLSWFDEAVKDAFDKSDQLMLEIVMPEDQAEMAKIMLPLAIDQSGKTLSSRLGAEDLAAYQAAMTKVGVPPAQFDMFEPWFAGITLTMLPLIKLGYAPEQGAEKQLTGFAKSATKPVTGLETIEQQLAIFDTLPEDQQLAFLNAVVKDIDKVGTTLDTLVEQWSKGDPEGLAATMNESLEATPELAEALLYRRNANWADQIKTRMEEPGTVFIAVGAGHLAGKRSVQDYLKERGLTVTRVDY